LKLFIDTWGWLTLRDRKESKHQQANRLYRWFRRQQGIIYTTDYVLDETITLLFRRLPFEAAIESLDKINKAIERGYLQLEWITPRRFEKAEQMRLRYQDKPRISFTDLTSMVIMEELDIKGILTEDKHFEQVGMGFRCKP